MNIINQNKIFEEKKNEIENAKGSDLEGILEILDDSKELDKILVKGGIEVGNWEFKIVDGEEDDKLKIVDYYTKDKLFAFRVNALTKRNAFNSMKNNRLALKRIEDTDCTIYEIIVTDKEN